MALHLIQAVTVIISINFCSAPGSKGLSFSLGRPGFLKTPGVRHSLLGTRAVKKIPLFTQLMAWVGTVLAPGPPPLRFI